MNDVEKGKKILYKSVPEAILWVREASTRLEREVSTRPSPWSIWVKERSDPWIFCQKDKGITWREMEYLENPKKYIPGTKNDLAGIKRSVERAGLVVYPKKSY